MIQPLKDPPVSREQAETIATELLEKARAVNPKIERAPVNWVWLIPCCAAGVLAFLQGVRADNYGTIAVGAGLCLIGIVMGMRPVGGFSDLMAKLSSIPPQTYLWHWRSASRRCGRRNGRDCRLLDAASMKTAPAKSGACRKRSVQPHYHREPRCEQ
jgi:hypothetical protein